VKVADDLIGHHLPGDLHVPILHLSMTLINWKLPMDLDEPAGFVVDFLPETNRYASARQLPLNSGPASRGALEHPAGSTVRRRADRAMGRICARSVREWAHNHRIEVTW